MSHTPSIDYSCPHCGARQIYEVVPIAGKEREQRARLVTREIPSIDFSCSRCGSSKMYKLVPMSVRESVS